MAVFIGHGPDTWRLAAQIVAAIASVVLIIPIYALTCVTFRSNASPAWRPRLTALLPRAAELGHDTLSDSLGLMCTFLALWLGAISLRRGDLRFAARVGTDRGGRLPGAARSDSRPACDRAGMDGGPRS